MPRVVAWLSLAGITALISQGWGRGTVGHRATVTWQKHPPSFLCHLENLGKQAHPNLLSGGGAVWIGHGGPGFLLLQFWLTLDPGTVILNGPASVYLLW